MVMKKTLCQKSIFFVNDFIGDAYLFFNLLYQYRLTNNYLKKLQRCNGVLLINEIALKTLEYLSNESACKEDFSSSMMIQKNV